MSDSGTLADDTESSLADTDVLPRSEGRGTSSLDLQYVYYRVYNEDGAGRSLHPLNPDDPSLSRIYARSVAPPHTAASLKRFLCRVEGVTGPTTLFTTTPGLSPMNDGDRISFLTEACPGLTTQDPMTLVHTGRKETTSTIGSSTEGFMTHCLYYRMYAEDGAIRSIQPLNADDPSLSRIYARSVPPPHTVASLKCRLCKVENISGDTNLYAALSSSTAMNDGERILLYTDMRPGLTMQDPMAFVVTWSDLERTALLPAAVETRYVYYRLYTPGDEWPSKRPVDPNDPSLGRIKVDSIPPPRDVASMRKAILRVEKLVPSWPAQLFVNMFSESPMDETHDPNLAGDFPFSLDQPLVVVLRIHTFKARETVDYSNGDRSWLTIVNGETYYTDGVLLKKPYMQKRTYDSYRAVNSAGAVGFVSPDTVEKISQF